MKEELIHTVKKIERDKFKMRNKSNKQNYKNKANEIESCWKWKNFLKGVD